MSGAEALNFDDLFDKKEADKKKAPEKSPIDQKWEAAKNDSGSKLHDAILNILDR